MNDLQYEIHLKEDITKIFQNIITEIGEILDIYATARAGAQISDFLEDAFVDYLTKKPHPRVKYPQSAPKSQTKNPYDICWTYEVDNTYENSIDLIWGDIKATKVSFDDSNPDLGTPTKMIHFMQDGHFHMMFIFFEYNSTSENKVQLIKYDNGYYAKVVLLKDINHTVRINPKPQFQVNINSEEEYRTKEEFIDLFEKKYNESLDRQIANAKKKKERISSYFKEIRDLHKNIEE